MFPEIVEKRKKESINDILLLFMGEFGWSYEQFSKTPIPIIFRMLEAHTKQLKQKNKGRK